MLLLRLHSVERIPGPASGHFPARAATRYTPDNVRWLYSNSTLGDSHMTRTLRTALLTVALAAACTFSAAMAQPSDADRINPVAPGIDEPVTLVDSDGEELATITVTEYTDGWTEYPQNHKPRSGTRYVGFAVEVESLARGAELDADDFDLQIDPGTLLDAATVQTSNEEMPVLKGDIDLDKGESAAFVIVYSVPEDTVVSQLFWADDDVLITIYSAANE